MLSAPIGRLDGVGLEQKGKHRREFKCEVRGESAGDRRGTGAINEGVQLVLQVAAGDRDAVSRDATLLVPVAHAQRVLQNALHFGRKAAVAMIVDEGAAPPEKMRQTGLMNGLAEAAVARQARVTLMPPPIQQPTVRLLGLDQRTPPVRTGKVRDVCCSCLVLRLAGRGRRTFGGLFTERIEPDTDVRVDVAQVPPGDLPARRRDDDLGITVHVIDRRADCEFLGDEIFGLELRPPQKRVAGAHANGGCRHSKCGEQVAFSLFSRQCESDLELYAGSKPSEMPTVTDTR